MEIHMNMKVCFGVPNKELPFGCWKFKSKQNSQYKLMNQNE